MAQAPRLFVLRDPAVRQRAADYILRGADDGSEVLITAEKMNHGQRSKFHALCNDLERSGLQWNGRPLLKHEWKVLLISGHAVATRENGDDVEMVRGIEGELVSIRESTATMSKARGASLISYTLAFCDAQGVRTRGETGQ